MLPAFSRVSFLLASYIIQRERREKRERGEKREGREQGEEDHAERQVLDEPET